MVRAFTTRASTNPRHNGIRAKEATREKKDAKTLHLDWRNVQKYISCEGGTGPEAEKKQTSPENESMENN